MTDIPFTETFTLAATDVNESSSQHTPEHAQNVGDEPIIYEVQACFPGSSCVTSAGKQLITFLVNEELVPIKIEKLISI